MTETEIRKQVKDYLAAKGWFCFHIADLEAAGGEYILCRGVDDLQGRGI